MYWLLLLLLRAPWAGGTRQLSETKISLWRWVSSATAEQRVMSVLY